MRVSTISKFLPINAIKSMELRIFETRRSGIWATKMAFLKSTYIAISKNVNGVSMTASQETSLKVLFTWIK